MQIEGINKFYRYGCVRLLSAPELLNWQTNLDEFFFIFKQVL